MTIPLLFTVLVGLVVLVVCDGCTVYVDPNHNSSSYPYFKTIQEAIWHLNTTELTQTLCLYPGSHNASLLLTTLPSPLLFKPYATSARLDPLSLDDPYTNTLLQFDSLAIIHANLNTNATFTFTNSTISHFFTMTGGEVSFTDCTFPKSILSFSLNTVTIARSALSQVRVTSGFPSSSDLRITDSTLDQCNLFAYGSLTLARSRISFTEQSIILEAPSEISECLFECMAGVGEDVFPIYVNALYKTPLVIAGSNRTCPYSCPFPKYSPSGIVECVTCNGIAGNNSCELCPPGSEANEAYTNCSLCKPGRYNPNYGGFCDFCPWNFVAPNSGAKKCDACPVGANKTVDYISCLCEGTDYVILERSLSRGCGLFPSIGGWLLFVAAFFLLIAAVIAIVVRCKRGSKYSQLN